MTVVPLGDAGEVPEGVLQHGPGVGDRDLEEVDVLADYCCGVVAINIDCCNEAISIACCDF